MTTRDEYYCHEERLEREAEGDVERCIDCNCYFAIEEMLLEANASYSGFNSICMWCWQLRLNDSEARQDDTAIQRLLDDGGRD